MCINSVVGVQIAFIVNIQGLLFSFVNVVLCVESSLSAEWKTESTGKSGEKLPFKKFPLMFPLKTSE